MAVSKPETMASLGAGAAMGGGDTHNRRRRCYCYGGRYMSVWNKIKIFIEEAIQELRKLIPAFGAELVDRFVNFVSSFGETMRKSLSSIDTDLQMNYLHHLKSWFRQKTSKEDFDMEARKLLNSKTVHLHNEFLLAIFSKCHTFTSSLGVKSPPTSSHSGHSKLLKKGKLKKRPPAVRSSFQKRFVPVNPMSCAVQATYKGVEDCIFAGRELSLPDISMIHGRLLVCAWETGLVTVDDAVVKLVMQALEMELKNIITRVLSRRNGYKVREGRFLHAMGTQVPNPYTRHSHMLQDRTLESEATMITGTGQHVPNRRLPQDCNEGYVAQQLSTSTVETTEREPVTLYNLLEALQMYRSAIPSHAVYAPAIERIIHRLWHPSHEELESGESGATNTTLAKYPLR